MVEKVKLPKILFLIYFLLITVFVPEKGGAEDAEDCSFKLEENYSSFSGFEGRMITEYRNIKIFLLDFRGDSQEENKKVFSFYSPYFSIGRIKKQGLLKEMANPSYWYAGSDTYSDVCGIFEDLTFNKNGDTGITLIPLNGLYLYSMWDEEENISELNEKGGSFSYSFSERLKCRIAFTDSERKESSDESWYFERDIEYGDNIYNIAAVLNHEGDIVINSFSIGRSSGSCFKSGSFVRYSPEISIDAISLYFLISLSDSSYRKPETGYPKIKLRRGVKGQYIINSCLEAESGYNLDIYHTEYSDQIENCMGESYFLKLDFDTEYFYLLLEGNRKNKTEDVVLSCEDFLSCKTGITGRKYSFSAYTRFKYIDYELFSRLLTLESVISIGSLNFLIKNKREISAAQVSSISLGSEGGGVSDENGEIEEGEVGKIGGKRVNNILSIRISNAGEHVKLFAEAEYETLDEANLNLKSVFRFSAGSSIRY